jgi:hypothetical protein
MLDCKDDESGTDSSLPTDVPTSRAPPMRLVGGAESLDFRAAGTAALTGFGATTPLNNGRA